MTSPAIPIRLAVSGYAGEGKLTAVPLSTPPETGFSNGFGIGAGGASESSTTSVALLALAPPLVTSSQLAAIDRSPAGTGSDGPESSLVTSGGFSPGLFTAPLATGCA